MYADWRKTYAVLTSRPFHEQSYTPKYPREPDSASGRLLYRSTALRLVTFCRHWASTSMNRLCICLEKPMKLKELLMKVRSYVHSSCIGKSVFDHGGRELRLRCETTAETEEATWFQGPRGRISQMVRSMNCALIYTVRHQVARRWLWRVFGIQNASAAILGPWAESPLECIQEPTSH